jgi:hypothetical protein
MWQQKKIDGRKSQGDVRIQRKSSMGSYILCTSREYGFRCSESGQAESEVFRGGMVITTLMLLSGGGVGESSSAGDGGAGSGQHGCCGGNDLITAKHAE